MSVTATQVVSWAQIAEECGDTATANRFRLCGVEIARLRSEVAQYEQFFRSRMVGHLVERQSLGRGQCAGVGGLGCQCGILGLPVWRHDPPQATSEHESDANADVAPECPETAERPTAARKDNT